MKTFSRYYLGALMLLSILVPASLNAQTATPTLVCTDLPTTLMRGMDQPYAGSPVIKLQTFLAAKGYLKAELINGTFGGHTEEAVQFFQKDNGIVTSGTPSSTGYGVAGALTRTKIKEISCGTPTVTPTTSSGNLKVSISLINNGVGTLKPQDFGLSINDRAITNGSITSLNAGTYTVHVGPKSGYKVTNWSQDCASNGTITLKAGDTKVCTVTIDDIPVETATGAGIPTPIPTPNPQPTPTGSIPLIANANGTCSANNTISLKGAANVNLNLGTVKGSEMRSTLGMNTVRLWHNTDYKKPATAADFATERKFKALGFITDSVFVMTPNASRNAMPTAEQTSTWFQNAYAVSGGSVDIWELNNEPEYALYWPGTVKEFYDRILVPGYNALHAKGAFVMSGATSGGTDRLKELIGYGLIRDHKTDAIAYHPFGSVNDHIARIKEARSLIGTMPLFITEWNIDASGTQWSTDIKTAYNSIKGCVNGVWYSHAVVSETIHGQLGMYKTDLTINQPYYSTIKTLYTSPSNPSPVTNPIPNPNPSTATNPIPLITNDNGSCKATNTISIHGITLDGGTPPQQKAQEMKDVFGMQSVRLWKTWRSATMDPKTIDMSDAREFKSKGYKVVIVFSEPEDTSTKNKQFLPTYQETFNFFTNAQAEFGDLVDYWELNNEPNLHQYWPGTMKQYYDLVQVPAYDALHPKGEFVISGAMSEDPRPIKELVGYGLLNKTDAVGFHPYQSTVADHIRLVREVRGYIGAKPLFITEWNIKGYGLGTTGWANSLDDMYNGIKGCVNGVWYFHALKETNRAGGGLYFPDLTHNEPFYSALKKIFYPGSTTVSLAPTQDTSEITPTFAWQHIKSIFLNLPANLLSAFMLFK